MSTVSTTREPLQVAGPAKQQAARGRYRAPHRQMCPAGRRGRRRHIIMRCMQARFPSYCRVHPAPSAQRRQAPAHSHLSRTEDAGALRRASGSGDFVAETSELHAQASWQALALWLAPGGRTRHTEERQDGCRVGRHLRVRCMMPCSPRARRAGTARQQSKRGAGPPAAE